MQYTPSIISNRWFRWCRCSVGGAMSVVGTESGIPGIIISIARRLQPDCADSAYQYQPQLVTWLKFWLRLCWLPATVSSLVILFFCRKKWKTWRDNFGIINFLEKITNLIIRIFLLAIIWRMAAECTALDDRIIKLERSHYGCPKEITEVDESMRRARTSVESLGLYSSRWTYVTHPHNWDYLFHFSLFKIFFFKSYCLFSSPKSSFLWHVVLSYFNIVGCHQIIIHGR